MSKKIIEIFGHTNQADREVGIEIEMEGHNLGINCRGWMTDEDGSLRGESIEYILRRPIKHREVPLYLNRLQTHLKENGADLRPSDRCGVHIHINCQQLTLDEVFKFAVLYMVVEDLLVKWCGPTREGNLFCLRARDAEALVFFLTEAIQKSNITNLVQKDIRYAAINFTSLEKYGSLEFRTMETPKDFSSINTWVDMLMAIKDASLQYNELHNIIEDISVKGAKKFLTNIFKENAEKLFCKDMEKMLIASARRIQDAAYAHRFKKKVNQLPNQLPEWLESKQDALTQWCTLHGYTYVYLDLQGRHFYYKDTRNNLRRLDYIIGPNDGVIEDVPDSYFNHQLIAQLRDEYRRV